jgi:predicted DNA-binding protein (MmcQ/YjbR family)
MNIEQFREYCLKMNGVTEDFPFDNTTLVFRVGNKIFALMNVDRFEYVNLKCEPARALDLREQYSGIRPGYHMNKQHWNSVYAGQDVPDQLFYELALHSYELIKASLPAAIRKTL